VADYKAAKLQAVSQAPAASTTAVPASK
jgi:hypothetical protein